MQIVITVSGERASGKTAILNKIAVLLKDENFELRHLVAANETEVALLIRSK